VVSGFCDCVSRPGPSYAIGKRDAGRPSHELTGCWKDCVGKESDACGSVTVIKRVEAQSKPVVLQYDPNRSENSADSVKDALYPLLTHVKDGEAVRKRCRRIVAGTAACIFGGRTYPPRKTITCHPTVSTFTYNPHR